jgi:hypothetical protein
LRQQPSFTGAFEKARKIIAAREEHEGKAASNPQIYIGSAMPAKLQALERDVNHSQ